MPIPEGSKVMVYTTPSGVDKGLRKDFVHVSHAITFFNEQKEVLKEQKAVCDLLVGKDVTRAVKLVSIKDGKC